MKNIKRMQHNYLLLYLNLGFFMILSLFLIYKLYVLKPETTLITVDSSAGTRFVTDKNDLVLLNEKILFSKNYVTLIKDFNESFNKSLSEASAFSSVEVWDVVKAYALDAKGFLDERLMKARFQVLEVSKEDEELIFTLKINNQMLVNDHVSNMDEEIKLKLTEVPRTPSNPWGLMVSNFSNEKILGGF